MKIIAWVEQRIPETRPMDKLYQSLDGILKATNKVFLVSSPNHLLWICGQVKARFGSCINLYPAVAPFYLKQKGLYPSMPQFWAETRNFLKQASDDMGERRVNLELETTLSPGYPPDWYHGTETIDWQMVVDILLDGNDLRYYMSLPVPIYNSYSGARKLGEDAMRILFANKRIRRINAYQSFQRPKDDWQWELEPVADAIHPTHIRGIEPIAQARWADARSDLKPWTAKQIMERWGPTDLTLCIHDRSLDFWFWPEMAEELNRGRH